MAAPHYLRLTVDCVEVLHVSGLSEKTLSFDFLCRIAVVAGSSQLSKFNGSLMIYQVISGGRSFSIKRGTGRELIFGSNLDMFRPEALSSDWRNSFSLLSPLSCTFIFTVTIRRCPIPKVCNPQGHTKRFVLRIQVWPFFWEGNAF